VGPSAPLDTRGDLPQSVAWLVARTREPLVLDDASADDRFAGDPCIAARGTKSVLCLPLLHQGRLSGVLYLEHGAATAAFNAARVELLGLLLLASQAAISIENARLLSSARAASEEVQRVNARLEGEVAARTEELRSLNRELGATNARLQSELRQRELAERERAALQEQMIEAQRTRLLELSTPLMPITDRIMVMPLLGAMDTERASQVLETALEGAQRHQARVVILDVTGLRDIDTHIAGTLVGVASALRLLGTQAVLTGIRPEAAQAMVHLDLDMRAIVTRGSLQSGFAYALRSSGEPGRLATGRGGAHAPARGRPGRT
jgi:anti-anti-sigma regulatory factor